MKRYRVEVTKSAKKEFDCLPQRVRQKVMDALLLLSSNPFSELLQIKKIKQAESLYRVRLGDYRLLYEIRQNVLLLIVIRIGHRKDVYR